MKTGCCSAQHMQTEREVPVPDCCFESSSLGLLLGVEAPVLTPDSVALSLLFYWFLVHAAGDTQCPEQPASKDW